MAPEVEFVPDLLVAQALGEPQRAVERARRVLPLALAADEHQAQPRAQPAEVVAVEIADVVDRAVEIRLVAALAPRVAPGRRVVAAREAQREREEVGALEGEVRRVVGAEAAPGGDDLRAAAAVAVDPGHDLLEDPRLV